MKTRIMVLTGLVWFFILFLVCRQLSRELDSVSKITDHYIGGERIFSPMYDITAKLLVFQPLFSRNERGDIVGLLVERWDHSEDYKTWTCYLRPGIRWHDGVPLTAQDVRFTLDLYTHPGTQKPIQIRSALVPGTSLDRG